MAAHLLTGMVELVRDSALGSTRTLLRDVENLTDLSCWTEDDDVVWHILYGWRNNPAHEVLQRQDDSSYDYAADRKTCRLLHDRLVEELPRIIEEYFELGRPTMREEWLTRRRQVNSVMNEMQKVKDTWRR